MHADVHLSREPNTCIFQVLLAYFPHSCNQTCIFQVLLAYFPHLCTQMCILNVHLVAKNAMYTYVWTAPFITQNNTRKKKEGCNHNMMLKSVTSTTLPISTL